MKLEHYGLLGECGMEADPRRLGSRDTPSCLHICSPHFRCRLLLFNLDSLVVPLHSCFPPAWPPVPSRILVLFIPSAPSLDSFVPGAEEILSWCKEKLVITGISFHQLPCTGCFGCVRHLLAATSASSVLSWFSRWGNWALIWTRFLKLPRPPLCPRPYGKIWIGRASWRPSALYPASSCRWQICCWSSVSPSWRM